MTKRVKILSIVSAIILIIDTILLCFLFIERPLDEKSLYHRIVKKTVEIRCSNDKESYAYATGAFVSETGDILTNKHVIMVNGRQFDFIEVRCYDEEAFRQVQVIKVSEEYDLALISIEEKVDSYFKLAKDVAGGEIGYTVGNPNGFGLSFNGGYISSPHRLVLYENQQINAIQTNIAINEGNSGGPLCNSKGKLIGLISFRLRDYSGEVIQGVSFALHLDVIKGFLI